MTQTSEQVQNLERAAQILKVIAHPVRIAIINLLKDGPNMAVGEIQQELGLTQSMTSQHLSSLKSVGILGFHKEANMCHYYLENKKVIKLLNCLNQCAC